MESVTLPIKPFQYIIMNTGRDLALQWKLTGKNEADTILFDTEEEANKFMVDYPAFFVGETVEIQGGYHYIDNSVNFKDIPQEQLDKEREVQKVE